MNDMLNRFSMYHGLLYGLVGIWGAAFVFSITGVLSYNALAMVASVAALAVSTGLASWLFGILFGVRSQGVSSLITAFILALIFTPTLEFGGLVVLALTGLIAGASKYVLAYKGRHLFNPAAVAAVIISLTGLGGASWWVATPPLTLFVVAVGAISLYKTKNYALVGTFLAVSVPLLVMYLASNGLSIQESLPLLLSWPLVFFAGIVLTEPLTLPPKRWQRVLEAAVVGVMFVVPFHIGPFETNPAVALLIGNVLAACFAHRRAIRLTYLGRKQLTPTTYEYQFKPNAPVMFAPGQYMEVAVPHSKQDQRGERRRFSITSTPGAAEVSFGIKHYRPSSTYKQALDTLNGGATLAVQQVSGDFTLPKNAAAPLLFVAGGIGVTPFIAQLRAMAVQKEARNVHLVYAVRSEEEIAYKEELVRLAIEVTIIAPTKPHKLPTHWTFVEGTRLNGAVFDSIGSLDGLAVGYVSGPPLFVKSTVRLLKKAGIKRVKTDSFVGY